MSEQSTQAAGRRLTFDVLVIGGGIAGTTAAACIKNLRNRLDVALIEPDPVHHYRPGWTLVASGQASASAMQRPRERCVPAGIDWLAGSVTRVDAAARTVHLADGRCVGYQVLVVAVGVESRWHEVSGLEATLGRNGVTSIYRADLAQTTRELIDNFRGGKALFVRPRLPIQCAGSAQSILYVAADRGPPRRPEGRTLFSRRRVFAAQRAALRRRACRSDPPLRHRPESWSRLLAVDGPARKAIFQPLAGGPSIEHAFDLLHVAPPQGPPRLIADSGLGDAEGWLPVYRATLRHLTQPRIYGIGDCTTATASKTVAAIRAQAPVVARNVLAALDDCEPEARYDGYSACPILTSQQRVPLAEFGHNGQVMPSFSGDPRLPRRRYALLKRHVLPRIYWRMLDGNLGIDWHAPLRDRRVPLPVVKP